MNSTQEAAQPPITSWAWLAAMGALFLALFSTTFVGLVRDWNSRPDASHGWLVLPLALWLAWRRRDDVMNAPSGVFAPAAGLVIVGLLAGVIGTRASLDAFSRLGLVTTLNGLLLLNLGWARYRRVAFPALFLFLMIPVPITITGAVTFPLQMFATRAAGFAIGLTGIHVVRLGNVLRLPAGSLEVAEACSGLRSAMTFVTLGALTAWMTPGLIRKAIVLALALPFAMIGNVLRITATGLLLEWIGPAAAQGTLHEAVGLLAFLVGLGAYAATARALGSQWTRS